MPRGAVAHFCHRLHSSGVRRTERGREFTPSRAQEKSLRLLMLHVMKTAGTSLRDALQRGVGLSGVFPNDQDLSTLPNHWYPGPERVSELLRTGQVPATARVIIGHLPYVTIDAFDANPLVAVVLRDPVSRTVSMMEHRRRHSAKFAGQSYEQLLSNDDFVERQVRNYQTKMFAFDDVSECRELSNGDSTVNIALSISEERFSRALGRFEATEVVGVTEDVATFVRMLRRRTGWRIPTPPSRNVGQYVGAELKPTIVGRIRALTAYDHVLYQLAQERVAAEKQTASRWFR